MTTEQYESIFYKMKDKLYRYALRFTGDSESAEDVVQDVMHKLWQKRDETDNIENIEAWLMVLTRKVKDNHVPVEEAWSVSDDTPIPDRQMETNDLMTWLMSCLDKLPEKQRTVFQLREIEQMTYDEISGITGFTLDDVKVTLFRARKHMQRLLGKISEYNLYQA
jgi:RNA polymerase sigma factor (sigma-70 family)